MAKRVEERLDAAKTNAIYHQIVAGVADCLSDNADKLMVDGGPDPKACLDVAGEAVTYVLAQLGRVVGVVDIGGLTDE